MSCGEQLIYLGGRVGIIWYPASFSYPTGADDLPHQVPLLLAGSRSVFLFHLQQSSKHPLGLVLLSSTDWLWLSHSDTEQSSTPFFSRGAFLRRPSLGRSEDRLIGLRKGSCTLHPDAARIMLFCGRQMLSPEIPEMKRSARESMNVYDLDVFTLHHDTLVSTYLLDFVTSIWSVRRHCGRELRTFGISSGWNSRFLLLQRVTA